MRDDVKFFDDIPGYPRLMNEATREVEGPKDNDYFSLFPVDDEAAPATSAATPEIAVPPPALLP